MKDAKSQQALDFFLEKCADSSIEELTKMFNALFTDKEKHDLANRLRIFAMIQQGATQREISASLGVGIATVTRGVKAYQQHEVDRLFPEFPDFKN